MCQSLRASMNIPSTDPQNFTDLQVRSFEPKPFEADDVEIAITHCGVCGSDVHTLKRGWGDPSTLPLVVGHEIVGHAVRVGKNVKGVKVGDRVGVGAQVWSCMECRQCKDGYENYCPKQVDTYVSTHLREDPSLVIILFLRMASTRTAPSLRAVIVLPSARINNSFSLSLTPSSPRMLPRCSVAV